ncbi:MAG: hypothetical protein ABIH34_03520 [Nanoarchaeota archaeon]
MNRRRFLYPTLPLSAASLVSKAYAGETLEEKGKRFLSALPINPFDGHTRMILEYAMDRQNSGASGKVKLNVYPGESGYEATIGVSAKGIWGLNLFGGDPESAGSVFTPNGHHLHSQEFWTADHYRRDITFEDSYIKGMSTHPGEPLDSTIRQDDILDPIVLILQWMFFEKNEFGVFPTVNYGPEGMTKTPIETERSPHGSDHALIIKYPNELLGKLIGDISLNYCSVNGRRIPVEGHVPSYKKHEYKVKLIRAEVTHA